MDPVDAFEVAVGICEGSLVEVLNEAAFAWSCGRCTFANEATLRALATILESVREVLFNSENYLKDSSFYPSEASLYPGSCSCDHERNRKFVKKSANISQWRRG